MTTLPAWQYDEYRHVGADYADPALAEAYDAQHQRFRGDTTVEADSVFDVLFGILGVVPGQTLIDLGCGTGTFAIQAARRGITVFAVDVSAAMLAVAERKAAAAGVSDITFCQGGFLTYEHNGVPADIIHSSFALHHLPDFWKLIGLRRLAGMLKDDGMFFLWDTVYSFAPEDYARLMAEKVAWFTDRVNVEFGQEVATAFREEFSTCDWIMEGLLTRAGFSIEQAEYPEGMLARYRCRKLSHRARRFRKLPHPQEHEYAGTAQEFIVG